MAERFGLFDESTGSVFGRMPPGEPVARCRSGISTGGGDRQLTLPDRLGRVMQRFFDVRRLEVGVGAENLIARHAGGDHVNDRGDGYPQPANAGNAPIWSGRTVIRVNGIVLLRVVSLSVLASRGSG